MPIDLGKSVRPAINQLHPPQRMNVLKYYLVDWIRNSTVTISEIRDINAGRFVFNGEI